MNVLGTPWGSIPSAEEQAREFNWDQLIGNKTADGQTMYPPGSVALFKLPVSDPRRFRLWSWGWVNEPSQ